MADINDTTPVPYSAFTGKLGYSLHEARAELAGAIALLEKDPSWESDDDRVSVDFMLKEISRKIDQILEKMDDSEPYYTIKQQ